MGEQTLSGPLGARQPARLSWPEGRSGAPGFLAILVFSFSIIAGPVAVGDTPLYNICRDKPCPTADNVASGAATLYGGGGGVLAAGSRRSNLRGAAPVFLV